jgi:hypothetical protein
MVSAINFLETVIVKSDGYILNLYAEVFNFYVIIVHNYELSLAGQDSLTVN